MTRGTKELEEQVEGWNNIVAIYRLNHQGVSLIHQN
jgi:hypothetical protein